MESAEASSELRGCVLRVARSDRSFSNLIRRLVFGAVFATRRRGAATDTTPHDPGCELLSNGKNGDSTVVVYPAEVGIVLDALIICA